MKYSDVIKRLNQYYVKSFGSSTCVPLFKLLMRLLFCEMSLLPLEFDGKNNITPASLQWILKSRLETISKVQQEGWDSQVACVFQKVNTFALKPFIQLKTSPDTDTS